MADDDTTTLAAAPTTSARSTGPGPESVGNAVGIALSVAAMLGTVVLVLLMWQVGDLWPTGGGNAVPPCLPNLDHHCLP